MVGRPRTLSLSINWGSTSLTRGPSTRSTVTVESIGRPGVLRKHSQTRAKDAHAQSNNNKMDPEKQKEHPRKLSRRSPSTSTSRWRFPSRKSSRQPDTNDDDDQEGDMRDRKAGEADSVKGSDDGRPMSMLEKQLEQQQLQNLSRLGASSGDLHRGGSTTIIPDPLPTYTDQLLRQIPGVLPPIRSNYVLHNPKGPKRYQNHHLIEPQTRMPISSTFSPSFPPLRSTANGATVVMDSLRLPGPSRSRSNSPLPSPNASQTRLGDGLTSGAPGTRSRKVSQTAHDNVDMLDASDPWGQNWHHHSPYDVGLASAPSQNPAHDPQIRSTGSRTGSTTNLNKPAVPSPLSKSTSAVNLAEPSATGALPRSASAKAGTTGQILRDKSGGSGGSDPVNHVKAHSAPVTPLGDRERASPDKLEVPEEHARAMRRKLSKRGRLATAPPAVSPTAGNSSSSDSNEREAKSSRPPLSGSAEKTHRRTSMLDKISKKFSLLRSKPINDVTKRYSSASPTKEHNRPESMVNSDSRRLSKRVPPPSAHGHEDIGHRSSASIDIEMPLTMGPLTIANPDTPSSGTASPVNIRSSLLHSQSSGQAEFMEDGQRLRQESESPVPPPKRPAVPLEVQTHEGREEQLPNADHSPRPPAAELEPDVHSQPSHQQLRPDGVPILPSLHLSPGRISLALSTTSSRPPPLPEKDDRVWAFVNPATLTDSPVEEHPPVNTIPEPQPEHHTPPPQVHHTPPPQTHLEAPPAAIPRSSSQQSLSKLAPPQVQHATLSQDTAFSRLSTIVNPPTPHVHASPMPSTPGALPEPMPAQGAPVPEQVDRHRRSLSTERPAPAVHFTTRHANWHGSNDAAPTNTSSNDVNVKRESRREERPRYEERPRHEERREWSSRPEERQVRAEERPSHREERPSRHEERSKYEDRNRREERPRRDSSDKERERLSRYEDKNRYEERTRRDSSEREREKARQEKSRQEDVSRSADRDRPPRTEEKQRQDSSDRERQARKERRMTTEKFKLIRTPSDNIRMVSDTIPVGEEQWTLVETTSNSRRDRKERGRDDREREKEKERERAREAGERERERDRDRGRDKGRDRASPEKGSSRRDSRRDDKYASVRSDPNQGHSSSHRHREDRHRSTITRAVEVFDQPIKPQRPPSTDRNSSNPTGVGHPSSSKVASHSQTAEKDRSSAEKRSSRREERPYASDPRSSYVNGVNDKKSSEAGPASAGRRSSNKRPVSEVPAQVDAMNSLNAREHWQADRLFKGRSTVIEPENRTFIPTMYDQRYSSALSLNGSIGSYPAIDASSLHGSAHTGYMVQSPFAGHPNSIYGIPMAPPPVMSSPAVLYPAVVHAPDGYAYFHPYPAFGENVPPFPASNPQSPQNPLPEPPRHSVYSPEPLRPGRPGSADDPSTQEYWSIYAGITSH